MRALLHDRYGSPDVLRVAEVEPPTPTSNQVLLRVEAASVNPLDWHYLTGTPYPVRASSGLRRPKQRVRGVDVAGVVEAVGSEVTTLVPGEAVFGLGSGTLAEFAVANASSLAPRPPELAVDQAAALPVAALTALQGLDFASVGAGTKVLVNGAAGGVGTFAVQIAAARGAVVTGVCSSANVDLVRSIGAATVVDYTQADVTAQSTRYDVIFDNMGNHPLSACRRMLTDDGVYLVVGGKKGPVLGPIARMIAAKIRFARGGQRAVTFTAKASTEQLTALAELVTSGRIRPIIGGHYKLDSAVDAVREIAGGHARGKLVVEM